MVLGVPAGVLIGLALLRSGVFVVPGVCDSPIALWTGGIPFRSDVLGCLTGMTALVPKPVILRVVRSIERVEQGLETSDRGFLRKVVCCHVAGRYRARFGREARRRSLPVRRSTGSALKWANLRTTFPSPATGSEDTRTLSDPGTALDGSDHVRPGTVRTSPAAVRTRSSTGLCTISKVRDQVPTPRSTEAHDPRVASRGKPRGVRPATLLRFTRRHLSTDQVDGVQVVHRPSRRVTAGRVDVNR